MGIYPETCGDCHTNDTWHPATWQHPTPLEGAHAATPCSSCHTGDPPVYLGTAQECVSCHQADYLSSPLPGHETFPTTCQDCHSTTAWQPAMLPEHSWPLLGAHATTECANCHSGNPPVYEGTPQDCVACHQADYESSPLPSHETFPTTCQDCHTTTGWKPATLPDHSWPLVGVHAMTECASCHVGNPPLYEGTPTDCVGCHQADHQSSPLPGHETFPTTCQDCHTTTGWKPATLPDHSWPLVGAHAMTQCASCHVGNPPVYEGTPQDCVGCHRTEYDQSPHPGHATYPTTCQDCHSTTGWKPATLPEHKWPLQGAHAVAECASCHVGNPPVYQGTPQDCVGCHRADYDSSPLPGHETYPTTCQDCHTTTAWKPATLPEHKWPLVGAHAAADCASCHVGNPPVYQGTPQDCVGCHRADYDSSPYPGHDTFPTTCQDCHTTTAWRPASGGVHPEDKFPITGRHNYPCNDCHNQALGPNGRGNADCVGCHEGVHSRARVDGEHDEVRNYPGPDAPPNFCLDCHNRGQELDD